MRLGRGSVKSRPSDPAYGQDFAAADQAPQTRAGRRYDPAWNDWTPPRRWPGILLSCAIVLGFLGVVIWHLRPHSTVHHTVVIPSQFHAKAPFSPAVRGTKAITFSGSKDRGNMQFTTNGGLLVLHAQCACQYNFVVSISSKNLLPIAFPVNTTGSFNEVMNATVPAGPIVIAVKALGKWSLQFVQPLVSTPTLHAPFKYFSSGNDVVGPFSSADRIASFQFLSGTSGAVAVHVLNARGLAVSLPFYGRIALSSLNKKLPAIPGPWYFLQIEAGGLWSLAIRH